MADETKSKTAELRVDGKVLTLPMLEDNAGFRAVDIRPLWRDGQVYTYDPGFGCTVSCQSAISHVDGVKGQLLYRGYPIEVLTEHCSFIEVAYLLIHGTLPNHQQSEKFSALFNRHSMIHEDMRTFFRRYPERAHPMAVLSAMVVSLSSFYPEVEKTDEDIDIAATRLLSKLRTIAAFSYKKSIGEPVSQPSYKLS